MRWHFTAPCTLVEDSKGTWFLTIFYDYKEPVTISLNRHQANFIRRGKGVYSPPARSSMHAWCVALAAEKILKEGKNDSPPQLTVVRQESSTQFLMLISFGALLLSGIAFAWSDFAPTASDFIWHEDIIFNVMSAWILGYILLCKHEIAHWFFARLGGLKAKIEFGFKWLLLFAETSLPGLYSLPESARLQIYMAGLTVDMVTIVALSVWNVGNETYFGGIVQQAILLQWLAMLWQTIFFFKTDIYLLITDLFDIEDFQDIQWNTFLENFRKGTWKISPHTLIYGAITLISGTILFYRYVILSIPILFTIFSGAFHQVIFPRNYFDLLSGFIVLGFESWRLLHSLGGLWRAFAQVGNYVKSHMQQIVSPFAHLLFKRWHWFSY